MGQEIGKDKVGTMYSVMSGTSARETEGRGLELSKGSFTYIFGS